MYYNSRQFSNFRGINLLAANGCIRFEDVDTAPTTTSGEYVMYVDGGVLYFDNGSGVVALVAAGGSGSVSWEAMYATDNTINIAGGNGLTIAGSMASSNNVLTLQVDAGSSGAALAFNQLGSGNDVVGTGSTWSISKAGVATFSSIVLTTSISTDTFAITNDTITANNALIVSGSGVFSGTGANSFVNITASGLTTGTALTVIANAATSSVGVVDISATGQTSGSTLRVTGGGANITSGGKVVEIAMGAAITGAGLSIVTTGIHAGTTTNSILAITNNSATTGTSIYLAVNGLTTGVAQLITSSGTMTTTGSLLTLTANSATTAAGIFRINANGLTSGIGAVIASSATAITGAGRLLRVDHTGATTTSGILTEFASAANDETEIVKITASSTLSAGVALDIAVGSMDTGTGILVTGTAITTGKGVSIAGLDALTSGIALNITSAATAITGAGRMLFSNHTGATGTSAILNEFKTAATDETILAQFTTAAMVNGVALKAVGTTGMTTGSVILATSSTAGAVATNGIISFQATGNFTSTNRAGFLNVVANTTTGGTVAHISATALTDGTILSLEAVEATLTTGLYIQCYDGAANDFSVAKYGATIIAGNAQGTAALTVTAGDLVLTAGNATVGGKFILSGTETIAAGGTSTALALTKSVHYIDADAGGDTFTLADGVAGQITTILLTSSTGTATITPTNLAGGTSVTLNADGDSVVLQFMDTEWFILGGNSYAVV